MIKPSRETRSNFAAVRLAGASSVLGALAFVLLGALPASSMPESGGWPVLGMALAAGLVGSAAGNVPAFLTVGGAPARFLNGFFAGLAARFILTLAVGLAAYALIREAPYFALLVWVGAAQGVFLAVDTAVLVRLNGKARLTR